MKESLLLWEKNSAKRSFAKLCKDLLRELRCHLHKNFVHNIEPARNIVQGIVIEMKCGEFYLWVHKWNKTKNSAHESYFLRVTVI